jgi:hypothetical protein
MPQVVLTCRACQRDFAVSAENLDQVEVRCPVCGLILLTPPRIQQKTIPPSEIAPWDPAWSDCG